MALDEPTDEDSVFDVAGFSFCIAKELLTTIGGATIDLNYMGFTVEPEIPLPSAGASSCGGSCSSGSCGA